MISGQTSFCLVGKFSGQSPYSPPPSPLLWGLALFLRYVLHRKQQRPDRVPVVSRLDKMTKDNSFEAGRCSRERQKEHSLMVA